MRNDSFAIPESKTRQLFLDARTTQIVTKYKAPPTLTPTAALNQREAAVVSPWTCCISCSSTKTDPFQIKAPPKKPTPDGNAEATRDASQPIIEDLKAIILEVVKKHAPKETNLIIRIPAGPRSAARRSYL